MSSYSDPWNDPRVAAEQRALVDRQLAETPWPAHFTALRDAVESTKCPGTVLEVGCASGYGKEILSSFAPREYVGVDVSEAAIEMARQRHPDATWTTNTELAPNSADVVIDGFVLLHVEPSQVSRHLGNLVMASRRWVILHRVPIDQGMTRPCEARFTEGYGKRFPSLVFSRAALVQAMEEYGAVLVREFQADGDSATMVFAKPRRYLTHFDRGYIDKARIMIRSLVGYGGPVTIGALCWDDEALEFCKQENTRGLPVQGYRILETGTSFPGPPRTRVEKMWTLAPESLWLAARGGPVTYVDADLKFFSSPEPVFAEIGGAGAAVFPHDFSPAGRPGPSPHTHEVFGRFNVGMVHVRDPAYAERWAEQCRAWCFDRLERMPDGRVLYADQKYLDDWPGLGAHVVTNPAAALGPWGIHSHELEQRDGELYFAGRPLISYHFSQFKLLPHGGVQYTRPEYELNRRQIEMLYEPYLREITER